MYRVYHDASGGHHAENWEDLKHGRWRDFFIGRPERRKYLYMRDVARARRGDKLTALRLLLSRWILQVTEEERPVWEAEAAEVEIFSIPPPKTKTTFREV